VPKNTDGYVKLRKECGSRPRWGEGACAGSEIPNSGADRAMGRLAVTWSVRPQAFLGPNLRKCESCTASTCAILPNFTGSH
jgi:hypothetical protein